MRLFIGIPLHQQTRLELGRLAAHFKPASEEWRWSPPEGWHITLQFLGKTSTEQSIALQSCLRAIRSAPIAIQLGNLGLFEGAGIFFADVVASSPLLALQQKVVAATAPCGFIAEDRPYHPHITLARLTGGGRGKSLQALRDKITGPQRLRSFIAEAFVLYESLP